MNCYSVDQSQKRLPDGLLDGSKWDLTCGDRRAHSLHSTDPHVSPPEWIFKTKHVLESRGHALELLLWEHVPETTS